MNYVLNTKQIDKLLKPLWDESFYGSKVGEFKSSYGDKWSGIIKDTDEGPILLIGHRVGKEDMGWYSNGKYFQGKWSLFSMTPSDFNKAMVRYVNDKFGLNVTEVI
jgi:hypothetical protein